VTAAWQDELYALLKQAQVRQVAYVPDAGHARLIRQVHEDADMRGIVLTTEEEGIAVACGAWLGGERAVLLMQSSGVGNCINMLSLVENGRFPFLCLVTMRGEWGEFNPWQVPMARATQACLQAMGVRVMRADHPGEVAPTVQAALDAAFGAGEAVAVLLGQRLIGAKQWEATQ
jgi:sulfopyruvate decarboxylase alpha subunit